jgi:hypothetical protein
MAKAAHHRGGYQVQAKRVTTAALLDEATRCWKCNRTLEQVRQEHPPHLTVHWCAGHVNPGEVDGELRPECSPCSDREGANLRNQGHRNGRFTTSRRW